MLGESEDGVPAAPRTAAAAIVGFAREFSAALLLRPAIYAQAVADPGSWRRAAVAVIIAALAADSIGLYTHVDEFLVVHLANWSLIPIMLLALARWSTACGVAWALARMFGPSIAYGELLRPSGYAHAPAALQFLPAIAYWLDIMQVTPAMLTTVRWLAVPWLLAALTLAAISARVPAPARAVAVAVTIFVAGNLFDVVLDSVLLAVLGIERVAVSTVPPAG